ncbi:unnamed protein product, partial [Ectocarpus sp. 4 AP-2014]
LGGSTAGEPCFLLPVQACSTLRAITPRFDLGQTLLQPWNPVQQQVRPTPKPRAKLCCQDCGHLYTTGAYSAAQYHTRSGGKYVCLVKTHFPEKVRQPDFPARAAKLYKTCFCAMCTSSA